MRTCTSHLESFGHIILRQISQFGFFVRGLGHPGDDATKFADLKFLYDIFKGYCFSELVTLWDVV